MVQEGNAGVHEKLWAHIGIATGDRGRGIDHCRGPAGNQRFGADSIQVRVVDDGDLSGLEALGEVLGPPINAKRSTRERRGASRAASGEA